jgi:hypothetical protein
MKHIICYNDYGGLDIMAMHTMCTTTHLGFCDWFKKHLLKIYYEYNYLVTKITT